MKFLHGRMLIARVVGLCVGLLVYLFASMHTVWPRNMLQYNQLVPISYHFGDYKANLATSLTEVNGATSCVVSSKLEVC